MSTHKNRVKLYGKEEQIEYAIRSTQSHVISKNRLKFTFQYIVEYNPDYLFLLLNNSAHPFSYLIEGIHPLNVYRGLSMIIPKILNRDIGIESDDQEIRRYFIDKDNWYTRIYPIVEGEYIYLTWKEIKLMSSIEEYVGYFLLSSNIMSYLSIDNLPNFYHVKKDGMVLRDVTERTDILNEENDELIYKLKSINRFSREDGNTIREDSDLLRELLDSFSLDY